MAVLTQIVGSRRGRTRLRQTVGWFVGLALALALGWMPSASAQPAASDEYKVKAAFLFHFTQFVEWPAKTFHDRTAPFVIGVLGEDPFGAYLDDLVRGEKIGGRPLVIRRYKRAEDPTDCQILFICRSETKELDKILAQLKGRSVLTVSDVDTFSRLGGMVRFVTESGKTAALFSIGLRINFEAAKACELTISSKLFRPGTIVTPGGN
jgi:hypothetical protein